MQTSQNYEEPDTDPKQNTIISDFCISFSCKLLRLHSVTYYDNYDFNQDGVADESYVYEYRAHEKCGRSKCQRHGLQG